MWIISYKTTTFLDADRRRYFEQSFIWVLYGQKGKIDNEESLLFHNQQALEILFPLALILVSLSACSLCCLSLYWINFFAVLPQIKFLRFILFC